MIDVVHRISSARRTVAGTQRGEGDARVVTIRQSYDTAAEDLWDACTNPERIPRWFLPVSGDLRVGGRFQLENHAGGTITACDPPHRFEATWEFGETVSWIAVSVSSVEGEEDRAELTLEHTVPVYDHWRLFGPGAVGVGWELGLLGLYLHQSSGGAQVDADEVMGWQTSEEGRRFMADSAGAWGDAHATAGVEGADEARAQAERTLAAYRGE